VNNNLSISIVIPVYNEEHHIKACLDAIAMQTIKPLEVIVVDNNCTDKTVAIAKGFPFVTIIREPVQGRGAARNAGFNIARGDIIGRIDADSIVMTNWVARVLEDFQDSSIMGLTGLGKTNLILGINTLFITFWSQVYFWTTHSFFDVVTMWGANMAIRRTTWEHLRHQVTLDDKLVHEDQDISMVMLGSGGKIIQDNGLFVITTGRSYLYWPKFWEYFRRTFNTKRFHEYKHTLPADSPMRIGFWRSLPGALLGWFFTVVFIIYSLAMWPVFAVLKHVHGSKLS
jgi:glycosyltransferase involved in cell wall biosynthesis